MFYIQTGLHIPALLSLTVLLELSKLCTCIKINLSNNLKLLGLFSHVPLRFRKETTILALKVLHVIMVTRSLLTEYINVLLFFHTCNYKRSWILFC